MRDPAYFRRRHAERRLWAVALLGGRCVGCGATEGLEFDHADPSTKEANISDKLGRWSLARLEKKLLKCQLLCEDCHLDKTAAEQAKPLEAKRASSRESSRRYRARAASQTVTALR